MKEISSLNQWADDIIGKYNTVSEGFDAQSPVTGKITQDEIARFRAGKSMVAKQPQKSRGPSPEIREKLKKLRDEFADKAGIAEADQPPQGSLWSPLSATTRDQEPPDPRKAARKRREAKRMQKFMGHIR